MPTRQHHRNPVARSPLLRKGGVHTVSKTGQRHHSRLNTQQRVDEWHEQQQEEKQNGEPRLPVLFSNIAPTNTQHLTKAQKIKIGWLYFFDKLQEANPWPSALHNRTTDLDKAAVGIWVFCCGIKGLHSSIRTFY